MIWGVNAYSLKTSFQMIGLLKRGAGLVATCAVLTVVCLLLVLDAAGYADTLRAITKPSYWERAMLDALGLPGWLKILVLVGSIGWLFFRIYKDAGYGKDAFDQVQAALKANRIKFSEFEATQTLFEGSLEKFGGRLEHFKECMEQHQKEADERHVAFEKTVREEFAKVIDGVTEAMAEELDKHLQTLVNTYSQSHSEERAMWQGNCDAKFLQLREELENESQSRQMLIDQQLARWQEKHFL